MKFIKVLEHNGELYKVGDTISAMFDTGITAIGMIKEFDKYAFFDEGLKDGIEFGDYLVPLDSIVEMKKIKYVSDDVMNFAVAVIAQVTEYANQRDMSIGEKDNEDKLVCLVDVEKAINKYLNFNETAIQKR